MFFYYRTIMPIEQEDTSCGFFFNKKKTHRKIWKRNDGRNMKIFLVDNIKQESVEERNNFGKKTLAKY